MRFLTTFAALAVIAGTLAAQAVPPPKTHLKIGDAAPEVSLRTTGPRISTSVEYRVGDAAPVVSQRTTGTTFKLSEQRGKTVVLAFFPAAFTGGCTKEMTAYQAGIAKFEEAGAVVVGISTDNLPALNYWAKEVLKLSFPLATDFSKRSVAEAYGVLNKDSGVANRASFVVDAEGKIQHIEEGSAAVDPTGAVTACARVKK